MFLGGGLKTQSWLAVKLSAEKEVITAAFWWVMIW